VTTRSRTVGSPDATRAVDWEQRIDFPRLRRERLDRAKAALEASDLGAVLLFDPNNIRYVTSTHIGEWARDKNARFTLLARGADPILWDFGSAARHHQLYAPWLPESSWRAGVTSMRGAMPEETGVPDAMAAKIVRDGDHVGIGEFGDESRRSVGYITDRRRREHHDSCRAHFRCHLTPSSTMRCRILRKPRLLT